MSSILTWYSAKDHDKLSDEKEPPYSIPINSNQKNFSQINTRLVPSSQSQSPLTEQMLAVSLNSPVPNSLPSSQLEAPEYSLLSFALNNPPPSSPISISPSRSGLGKRSSLSSPYPSLSHRLSKSPQSNVTMLNDDMSSSPSSLPLAHSLTKSTTRLSQSAPLGKCVCEICGKTYKSTNCLLKHRWEHTQGWKHTSKLSLSKHQQVAILEAASVLVGFSKDEEDIDIETVDDIDVLHQGQVWE
ncbi:hypothetical protein BC833DRAFT_573808 [Globomyces pollinis-pini]|nr:hypothetical protein BC833DRAFT_573808 [Globomyces pollinis-pini]KAJ3000610.1 hypothetical protein HDV02_004295 [Globomyces sp. JEL0801]